MQKEKIIYKQSTLPYYAVGVFWFIYATFVRMYKIQDILLPTMLSSFIFFILNRMIKPKEIKIVIDVKEEKTGNQIADDIITLLEEQSNLLLNTTFNQEKLQKEAITISNLCQQMIMSIKKDVNKANSIARTIEYIHSMLLKFVDQYLYFSALHSDSEIIISGLEQIEQAFEKIEKVYQETMDGLNKDHVLDLSLDIKVMETMFQQDELNIESFIKQSKGA